MKAALYSGNKTFAIGESEVVPPKADEVRVKVAYCGICGTDVHIYHGKMDNRVKIPQVIGHEMSGVVEEIGSEVQGFSVGEKVVVRPLGFSGCDGKWERDGSHIRPGMKFIGIDTPGAFQGYWTIPAYTLHKLPDSADLQVAALCEPLAVACHDVKLSKLKKGETAIILGGGPIGMLIAQVARALGANVLVSEIQPARLKMISDMGINTINPLEKDLEQAVFEITDGLGADVVFEVTASKIGAETMTKLPGIRGRIVLVGIFSEPVAVNLHPFFWKELQLFGARVYEEDDFETAIKYIAGDEINLEVLISGIYEIDDIQTPFEDISAGKNIIKALIKCS